MKNHTFTKKKEKSKRKTSRGQGKGGKIPDPKKHPPTFMFLLVGGKYEPQIVCAALIPCNR